MRFTYATDALEQTITSNARPRGDELYRVIFTGNIARPHRSIGVRQDKGVVLPSFQMTQKLSFSQGNVFFSLL